MSVKIKIDNLSIDLIKNEETSLFTQNSHHITVCNGYNVIPVRNSQSFSLICSLLREDDFRTRWDHFGFCLQNGYFQDIPVYSTVNWLESFIFPMSPTEDGYEEKNTRFRFIKALGNEFINELSLMIVIVGLYLSTGINWFNRLSLFVNIEPNIISKYGGDREDVYIRTFFYCMHFLAKKRNIIPTDTSGQFEIFYSQRFSLQSSKGIAFVYPKSGVIGCDVANFFTDICLILKYDHTINSNKIYTKSIYGIETFYFGIFNDIKIVYPLHDPVMCDHTVHAASKDVQAALEIDKFGFDDVSEEQMCEFSQLDLFLDIEDNDSLVKMKDIVLDKEEAYSLGKEYNDTDSMKIWLSSVHNGSKKNLSSLLFFLDKYKELMEKNPNAKVYFIGCGTSSWYQVIPTLLYDRHVTFIDKNIRCERMRSYPNVSFYYKYVSESDISDFTSSIVIMDIARDDDDIELLNLMIKIAKVSLCFMYKVRSSWMDEPLKLWAKGLFVPPFSHYGSAESRAYGSKYDSYDIFFEYKMKKKIVRAVKMRKTYYKCGDCKIFNWILNKFKKLPKDWHYFTQRPVDLDVLLVRTPDVCSHDYWSGNIYLSQCSSCISLFYERIGSSFSRWLCPVLKGKEFLSPFCSSKKQIKRSCFIASGMRVMMSNKFG